jgi:hypothetical protein
MRNHGGERIAVTQMYVPVVRTGEGESVEHANCLAKS